jgi:hypothetical protein
LPASGRGEADSLSCEECVREQRIDAASIVEAQDYMGQADIDATRRYLHYKSRAGEAARLAKAFEAPDLASGLQANGLHEPAAAFRAVQPPRRKCLHRWRLRGTARQAGDHLNCLPS